MIKKIKRLKDFGIYRDFTWGSETPEFSRFNLIYGWNKSGKSTLSRVFQACEKKSIQFKNYPSEGAFEIELADGSKAKASNLNTFSHPVMVFNTDFVEENVSFEPSNRSNPIVYLSEADIKKIERIRGLNEDRDNLIKERDQSAINLEQLKKRNDDFLTNTARGIKQALATTGRREYANYDRSNLRSCLDNNHPKPFKKLSDQDGISLLQWIHTNNTPLEPITPLPDYSFQITIDSSIYSGTISIHNLIEDVLASKVETRTIKKLEKNGDLNSWVQEGLRIHKEHSGLEICQFCGGELPANLLENLANHFSLEYQRLQELARLVKDKIATVSLKAIEVKALPIYSDLSSDLAKCAGEYNASVSAVNQWMEDSISSLDQKAQNPLSIYSIQKPPSKIDEILMRAVKSMNDVIARHNQKVDSHTEELRNKKSQYEHHLIASAIESNGYFGLEKELEDSESILNSQQERLQAIETEISALEAEMSDIAIAINDINLYLREFFGREEISIQLDAENQGYVIHRENEVANSLSEGERNAIAFAYFIVKTRERDFDVSKATIVIDDPISSFDSNFIFHCASLIRNHFENAGQLIITTHNFEFFTQIKNWFDRKISNAKKKNKPVTCEFFMIENIVVNEKRCALINPLEKTLKEYKSEYQFLFSRLYGFVHGDSTDYAWHYIIGNLARRFLESYLNFKIPNAGDLRSKIDQLNASGVSDTEKDKLYQLIQEESHARNPMDAFEHKDKSEITSAIQVLFKLIKETDPKHYETLEQALA